MLPINVACGIVFSQVRVVLQCNPSFWMRRPRAPAASIVADAVSAIASGQSLERKSVAPLAHDQSHFADARKSVGSTAPASHHAGSWRCLPSKRREILASGYSGWARSTSTLVPLSLQACAFLLACATLALSPVKAFSPTTTFFQLIRPTRLAIWTNESFVIFSARYIATRLASRCVRPETKAVNS
jgi:hypothetical protein